MAKMKEGERRLERKRAGPKPLYNSNAYLLSSLLKHDDMHLHVSSHLILGTNS